jgi:iron-sulfur cluster assembly accessory protein
MLTLTPAAVNNFKEQIRKAGGTASGIRVYSSGGGCCGPSFALDFVSEAEDGDSSLEIDSLKVYLEKEANQLLASATLDFAEPQGFILSGLAKNSCCG